MRWISVVAVLVIASLSSGCIPIGVRAGTMPFASPARPFGQGREVAKATDEHHRNAGHQQRTDLEASYVIDVANPQNDGHYAYKRTGDSPEAPDPQ